jgi:glutathione S-transferase
MTEPLTLHEYARSGNCYKIRLTAAHLSLTIARREYDIMKGETRTSGFLALVNANGRIPVLQVGDRFPARKQRRLRLSGAWIGADPNRSVRVRRHAAVDELGTI